MRRLAEAQAPDSALRSRLGFLKRTELWQILKMKILVAAVLVVLVAVVVWWRRGQAEPSFDPLEPLSVDDREAMKILASDLQHILGEIGTSLRPGMTTKDIDRQAEVLLQRAGMTPAMKGYNGFPAATAVSVNEEVVHGIPSKKRVLQAGDIVTVQISGLRGGLHAAMGWTFPVGEVDANKQRLIDSGKRALDAAVSQVRGGGRIGDISASIQESVESAGFSVVRDFVGYGIGRIMISEPQIPGTGVRGRGPRVAAGQTLNVQVILADGGWRLEILEDEWTAVTADGGMAAVFTAMVEAQSGGTLRLTQEPAVTPEEK